MREEARSFPEGSRGPLGEFLRERFGREGEDFVVASLSGDASTRRYYRLRQGDLTKILAVYPEPFKVDELSFAVVRGLLAGWGLPAPELLDSDEDRGVLVLEDLGDLRLQDAQSTVSEHRWAELYREAIGGLVTLQRESADAPQVAPCFQLAFDIEKLTWELDFFRQHFLQGLRHCHLSHDDHSTLEESFRRLSEEIAAWPRVLCHRDYHSRNLMLHANRLFWIDFQDARMGPATYDLASLLNDSYAELPEELASELACEFRERAVSGDSAGVFARRFDLMSVQRGLKALGTFGHQAVRGNPAYLSYVPRGLALLRRALRPHTELAPLHRVLARHIEELQ